VSAFDAVMIGDSENDLLAARAAGCRAILVMGGYNEGQPVATLPADAIVETLVDAVPLIAPRSFKSLQ
jgi:phosphoglycolate phosphatase